MKTLVNKNNPAIRITAPEIVLTVNKEEYWIAGIPQIPRTYLAIDWILVGEEPTCKESLQVEEEHPDNFTSFEWLIGRLMFRGCDLWGMTDGEDDNGVVTKLIKDRAAEMMELLERELDPNAESVDLEKEIKEWITPRNPSIDPKKETISGELYIDCIIVTARHFYKLGLKEKKRRNSYDTSSKRAIT